MPISDSFEKFVNAKSNCERHEAVKELKTGLKAKLEKDVKAPLKKFFKDAKKYGIEINISFGKKNEKRKAKRKS